MSKTALERSCTFDTPEALAHHVADWIVRLAAEPQRPFAICLSGGSTPRRLYELLATAPRAARLPWDCVHWFWGDERFVAHDHPDSNFRMAYESLFSRVPVSSGNIHAIPTAGLSAEGSAAAYEGLLKRYYGAKKLDRRRPLFDITLVGLGEDGHIASLFPGSDALAEQERWVVPVTRARSYSRITLTYPALESSRHVAFLVVGARKREVLARVRAGERTLPAARLHPVGEVHWFTDRGAAASPAAVVARE